MKRKTAHIATFGGVVLFLLIFFILSTWISMRVDELANRTFNITQRYVWESSYPMVLGAFLRYKKITSLFKHGELVFSWFDLILAALPWSLLLSRYFTSFGDVHFIGLLSGYFLSGVFYREKVK